MSSAFSSCSNAIAVPQSPNKEIRLLSLGEPIRDAVSPTRTSARLTLPLESKFPATLMAYKHPQHPIGMSMTNIELGRPNLACRIPDVGGVG